MKYAADFRAIARDALRGRWPVAILTGFVASLIGAGAVISHGGGGSSNSSRDNSYLAEELRVAITKSRAVMDGNKWRLFCLEWSFIGWDLLCSAPLLIALGVLISIAVRTESLLVIFWLIPLSIPLNVGGVFLRPYREAAYAAFYRDVSGTEKEAVPALNENVGTYTEWQ